MALAWLSAVCCSVFPEHAELPVSSSSSSAGGSDSGGGHAGTTTAGSPGAGTGAALVAPGGAPGSGGTELVASGAPGVDGGAGGGESASGGAGGMTGECASRDLTVSVAFDTWIDSAQIRETHATDASLSVAAAPDERRALVQLVLPASDGAELVRASLVLQLEQDADATGAARVLALHQLSREIGANTSWRNYTNKKWDVAGGDFGAERARVTLPASASNDARVSFDVTELVQENASAQPVTLSLVVLEVGPRPPASAELAFTSLEGDASRAAALLLSHCEP